MGVIDIRQRQETLGNIGSVRQATIVDQASMMRGHAAKIGSLAGSYGALANALANQRSPWEAVGKVAGFTKGVVDGVVGIVQNREKAANDNFVKEYQQEMDTFMLGDGTAANRGKFNEDFTDDAKWMKEIADKRSETVKRLREKHNIGDGQWDSQTEHMIQSYDEGWANRNVNRAFQVADRNRQEAAIGRRKECEQNLSMPNDNVDPDVSKEMYASWARSVNEELDAMHITDPAVRSIKFRERALALVGSQFKNRIDIAKADTYGEEDAKAVADKFDERFKEMHKDDGKIDFSGLVKDDLVTQALGKDGLSGQEKLFEAQWKAAKKSAVTQAEWQFRQNRYQSRQDAQDAMNALSAQWDQQSQNGAPVSPEQKAQAIRNLVEQNKIIGGTSQYPLEKYDKAMYGMMMGKIAFYEKMGKTESARAAGAAKKAADVDWDRAALDYLVMPKTELTPEQREAWLDNRRHFQAEFYDAFKRGDISREVASRIEGLLSKHFDAETEDAITHMLGRFGITVGTGMMFPSITSAVTDLTGKEDAPTPAVLNVKHGWFRDTEQALGTKDLGKYVNHFSYLMSKMPKGADAKKFAMDCEDEIIRMFLADADTDEVIKAMNIEFARTKGAEKQAQAGALRDVQYLNLKKGN